MDCPCTKEKEKKVNRRALLSAEEQRESFSVDYSGRKSKGDTRSRVSIKKKKKMDDRLLPGAGRKKKVLQPPIPEVKRGDRDFIVFHLGAGEGGEKGNERTIYRMALVKRKRKKKAAWTGSCDKEKGALRGKKKRRRS